MTLPFIQLPDLQQTNSPTWQHLPWFCFSSHQISCLFSKFTLTLTSQLSFTQRLYIKLSLLKHTYNHLFLPLTHIHCPNFQGSGSHAPFPSVPCLFIEENLQGKGVHTQIYDGWAIFSKHPMVIS